MSLKLFLMMILLSLGCSKPPSVSDDVGKKTTDTLIGTDLAVDCASKPDLPTVLASCTSDFLPCEGVASLKISQSNQVVRIRARAIFPDKTALGFSLEGEISDLAGPIKLADASKGRPFPPMAGLVEEREEEYDIVWDSLGDIIQVSFPRPDFIKIVYDVGLIDRIDLDRPHRRIKGEFTAPIRVRCYTGIPGSGEGVRDSDFSSDFCKKYVKHNYKFPPKPPIDDDF